MTDDYDEYDGSARLRRALAAAAAPAPTAVDPVAARRAGDARVRTRTAVTTSLAFSLVIFAGLGSVYFAAHRSRPSSLGSDVSTAPPSASPSPTASTSPPVAVAGYLVPDSPVAGQPAQLVITGSLPDVVLGVGVGWGDGTRVDDPIVAGACSPPAGAPTPSAAPSTSMGPLITYTRTKTHTWSVPGSYGITLRVTASCAPDQLASFNVSVLPAPVSPGTPPIVVLPTPIPSSAPASPSVSPKPSATATAAPTGTGSPTATASESPSRMAPTRPGSSVKPSPTKTPAEAATAGSASPAIPSPSVSPTG